MLAVVYKIVFAITFMRVVISGWSMYPTLLPGDYVLFDRWVFRLSEPKPGDVVLVRGLLGGDKKVVKRVVAGPGDRIEIEGGVISVNGNLLKQISIPDSDDDSRQGSWNLKAGEIFLLGDSVEHSTDSRTYGPVPAAMVIAKGWLICWPFTRFRCIS